MRGVVRWARQEPWMALNAAVATVAALTYASIHWLATLGIVRLYEVERVTSFGDANYGGSTYRSSRALGLDGPNQHLAHIDQVCWKLAVAAGIFWTLRLALRAAAYRIGALRSVGVMVGLGVFVAAGAMHRTTDVAVRRGREARTNVAITLMCAAFIAAFVVTRLAETRAQYGGDVLGTHVVRIAASWSIAANMLQLFVAVSGVALAIFLTASWWTATSGRPRSEVALGAVA